MKFLHSLLLLFLLLVTACKAPAETSFENGSPMTAAYTEIIPTASTTALPTQSPSKTPQPSPTSTPTQTALPPTITPTPQQLTIFSTSKLRTGVNPVTYLNNPCSYLENRWGEGKSAPGTIVVPIMFHSVTKPGRTITSNADISLTDFEYFMRRAEELDFTTITTEQLIGFLHSNAQIPKRSMIFILDDRRPGVTEDYFMPILKKNDWTLTLAWLSTDKPPNVWSQMEELAETGRLDVQSHGHDSVYIQEVTPIDVIERELSLPKKLIEEHFGTVPQAHIWSGGNFTKEAIDIAQDLGYEIGFSAYSRGPIMFNWIPLSEEEMAMNEPLMVLPRYWSTSLDVSLENALSISEEARKAAEEIRDEEMNYLEVYCQTGQGE